MRFNPLIALLLALPLVAGYDLITGNNGTYACPEADDIVYSPFAPWFAFYSGGRRDSLCWKAAICCMELADEARMQQFAATALVMGLLPLTLRDIAWPERRIVWISAPLPAAAAVLVRTLGLDPMVTSEAVGSGEEDVQRWLEWIRGSWIAAAGLRSRVVMGVLVVLSVAGLLVSYAALALVELYSKGSALGCVYPVFALTWCIVGFAPASVHTAFETMRRRRDSKGRGNPGAGRASAVQGVDEAWPVQLTWAIYYIAGTLVYTSIMALTVIELFVWVVVQLGVTATSKMVALYICLLLRNPVEEDAVRVTSGEEK